MSQDGLSKTSFIPNDAQRIACDLYGIESKARPLPSYDDQNFLLTVTPDERYVLKLSNVNEQRCVVEGQIAMLAHLSKALDKPTSPDSLKPNGFAVPSVIECAVGGTLTEVMDPTGATHLVRLITYLPGTPMAECTTVSTHLLRHLGASIATMTRALASFAHPGLHRDWNWDLRHAADVASLASVHIDPIKRSIIDRIFQEFVHQTSPLLETLPRGIIHGDANDYNLIVDQRNPDHIAGLIDFGDAIHSAIVCDIAITVAYAMLRRSGPVAAAAAVLAGYCSVHSLSEDELSLVPNLALTRLAVSVTQSVHESALDPTNSYISVSEASAWNVLKTLDALPAGAFQSAMAAAGTIGAGR